MKILSKQQKTKSHPNNKRSYNYKIAALIRLIKQIKYLIKSEGLHENRAKRIILKALKIQEYEHLTKKVIVRQIQTSIQRLDEYLVNVLQNISLAHHHLNIQLSQQPGQPTPQQAIKLQHIDLTIQQSIMQVKLQQVQSIDNQYTLKIKQKIQNIKKKLMRKINGKSEVDSDSDIRFGPKVQPHRYNHRELKDVEKLSKRLLGDKIIKSRKSQDLDIPLIKATRSSTNRKTKQNN